MDKNKEWILVGYLILLCTIKFFLSPSLTSLVWNRAKKWFYFGPFFCCSLVNEKKDKSQIFFFLRDTFFYPRWPSKLIGLVLMMHTHMQYWLSWDHAWWWSCRVSVCLPPAIFLVVPNRHVFLVAERTENYFVCVHYCLKKMATNPIVVTLAPDYFNGIECHKKTTWLGPYGHH